MSDKMGMKIICSIIWVILAPVVSGVDARDLYSDTWVAVDDLGRSLPGYDECGPPKSDRTVGIFYFIWLGQHSTTGPWDITKLLAENPENPAFGPRQHFHHWGESELGYYVSDDAYVIRRHVSMLNDAGVDVLIFDVTNAVTYEKVYLKICKIFTDIRARGGHTPQLCFMANSRSIQTVKNLYDQFYSKTLYPDLWFRWKGKPLIMAKMTEDDQEHSQEVRDFFTMRYCWAWTGGKDIWNWVDSCPQKYGWHESSDIPEEVSVAAAQHATTNIGRSFHDGKQPPYNQYHLSGTEGQGLCFAEQWRRALEIDPEFVFVTGWNEWVAQRFICGQDGCPNFLGHRTQSGETWFVDQYNQEYSRDIEPMKGGHGDHYYYQMIAGIRRYKGVRPLPEADKAHAILVDGVFSDWNDVALTYYDTQGDTEHRDEPGWNSTLHYRNTTGRNDLVLCKAAYDPTMIYFYVETVDPITASDGPHWMELTLNADQDYQTGWEGYDYRINGHPQSSRTSLEALNDQGKWEFKSYLNYRVAGNQMELAVPRALIGQAGDRIAFDFHWADNIQKPYDIVEFGINGDSAPNRRFNYRFNKDTGEN